MTNLVFSTVEILATMQSTVIRVRRPGRCSALRTSSLYVKPSKIRKISLIFINFKLAKLNQDYDVQEQEETKTVQIYTR